MTTATFGSSNVSSASADSAQALPMSQAPISSDDSVTNQTFKNQQKVKPSHSFWSLLFPVRPIIAVACLLILLPPILLTAESLLGSLTEQMTHLFKGGSFYLEWPFFAKLLGFSTLAIPLVSLLLNRMQVSHIKQWASVFPRAHRLHVAYQPQTPRSNQTLASWKRYRWWRMLFPPVLLTSLTLFFASAEFSFFNLTLDFDNASVMWALSAGLFMLNLLVTATGCAILYSIWMGLVTAFGAPMAVTEPDLSPIQIRERCERISFLSPVIWMWLPLSLFTYAVLGVWGLWLVTVYDVDVLWHLDTINWPLMLLWPACVFGLFHVSHSLKWLAYHHALVRYYARLPRPLKERLDPPPAQLDVA